MNLLVARSALALCGAIALAGCEAMNTKGNPTLEGDVNVIDATELNDIMLTAADPNEAVLYFREALRKNPKRIDFERGLAQSLVRARRYDEATPVYKKLVVKPKATSGDRIAYADALLRSGDLDGAKSELNQVPPTVETYKRYLLEAIVADNSKEWKKADSFYETARGLTTNPAPVMNNWGMSKLARGQNKKAEEYFQEAISLDPNMFSAKNNLVRSRGIRKNYELPIMRMSETEEAQLLHNLGIIATNNGDYDIARGLFELAVDTHPRHFKEAANNLAALDKVVLN